MGFKGKKGEKPGFQNTFISIPEVRVLGQNVSVTAYVGSIPRAVSLLTDDMLHFLPHIHKIQPLPLNPLLK